MFRPLLGLSKESRDPHEVRKPADTRIAIHGCWLELTRAIWGPESLGFTTSRRQL